MQEEEGLHINALDALPAAKKCLSVVHSWINEGHNECNMCFN